jgi:hypothetical protein
MVGRQTRAFCPFLPGATKSSEDTGSWGELAYAEECVYSRSKRNTAPERITQFGSHRKKSILIMNSSFDINSKH